MDIRKRGVTSQMVRLFIPDNSVTTGAGCTGLTYNSANLVISFIRELTGTAVSFHQADGDIEDISAIGTYQAPSANCCRFKAVDATNFPGLYEIHFINATAFGAATADEKVIINVREASTTALKIGPCMKEIELTAFDLQSAKAAATIAAGDIANDAITAAALATSAAAEIADAICDEVNTGTQHNVQNSIAQQIRNAGSPPTIAIRTGTLQAGSTSTTAKLDAGASATNDIYARTTMIVITSGVGIGQSRRIVSYNGTTKVATVDKAWTVTPTTSGFTLYAVSASILSFEGVATAGGNSTVDLPTTALATNDIYTGLVVIEAGTGAGQTEEITDYTGASRQISIAPATWSVNPSTDSVVAIIPSGNNAADTPLFPTVDEIASAILLTPANKISVNGSNETLVSPDVNVTEWKGTAAPDIASLAEINTEIDTALSDIGLDHLMKAAVTTTWAGEVTKDSVIDMMTSKDASQTFARSTDSTEAIKDSALSTSNLPTNFALFSIDTSGRVTLVPSQIQVKKNVAFNNFTFPMVSSIDHITPKTGLTIAAKRSIDGGAFVACANAASEISNGFYKINLANTDLNGTVISLLFTAVGADARRITLITQP